MTEEGRPFLFVGNHLALDFVNTQMIVRGKSTELLESFDDLLSWLIQTKLVTKSDAERIIAGLDQAERVSLCEEAKQLRATFREIAERISARKSVPDSAIASINLVLSRRPGYPQLVRTPNGFERRFHALAFKSQSLLASVAEAGSDLLCRIDFALIKKCANAACILYFYDTTKNHRRSWCSMQLCGNRMKAATHYRRNRINRKH